MNPIQQQPHDPDQTPKGLQVDPYGVWRSSPTPANMRRVLDHMRPTIDSALTTYVPGKTSSIARGRAKLLAIGAIKGYDSGRGASLKSHIMTQLQPMRRYARQAAQPMKISELRTQQMGMLSSTEEKFYDERGREASDEELADQLGISMSKIARIRAYYSPIISAEGSVEQDISAPSTSRVDQADIWIDYVYHDLDPVDRKILDWTLGRHGVQLLPKNEMARRLNISPSAVTQRALRIQHKLDEWEAVD